MDERLGHSAGGSFSPNGERGAVPSDRPDAPGRGALLRAAADGELTDAQQQDLAASSTSAAEDAARMGFERELRAAVGRVMEEPAGAPSALRERVVAAMLSETNSAPGAMGARAHRLAIMGRWAVALAVLGLAAGVMISGWQLVGPHPIEVASDQTNRLVAFLRQEHQACAGDGATFDQKMTARTMDDAVREAAAIFRVVPDAARPSAEALARAGYHFAGLGRCAVPGDGPSAHLVFEPDRPGGGAISLFIQVDTGTIYVPRGRASETPTVGIVVWKDERLGLVFYLLAPDAAARRAAEALFHPPQDQAPLG